MSIARPRPRRDDLAGAGSVAFLIMFTVLVLVPTTAALIIVYRR